MLCPSRAGEGLVGRRKKGVVSQGGKLNSDTNNKQNRPNKSRDLQGQGCAAEG
jgi:hypothetical protein